MAKILGVAPVPPPWRAGRAPRIRRALAFASRCQTAFILRRAFGAPLTWLSGTGGHTPFCPPPSGSACVLFKTLSMMEVCWSSGLSNQVAGSNRLKLLLSKAKVVSVQLKGFLKGIRCVKRRRTKVNR